jgi:hypothetical protein
MAGAHPAERHGVKRSSRRGPSCPGSRARKRHHRRRHHRRRHCGLRSHTRFYARTATKGAAHGAGTSRRGTASGSGRRHGSGPGSGPSTTTAAAGTANTVITTGGTGGSGSGSGSSASPSASATSSSPSIYWGGSIGTQFTGSEPPWDWSALTDFDNQNAGSKASSIVVWGMPFHSNAWCNGYCTFTTSLYEQVRQAGMIPWISWSSEDEDGGSGYSDAQIAAGSEDSYITQWAEGAKAWGHPFFLRFDWEMNGNWFPWGAGANGNSAADYVAMWRHVHDIFTRVGATNATWVWCPNVDPSHVLTPLASLYPGSNYVDWTCLDGYNGGDPWTSFHGLFAPTYGEITGTIAPDKPMIVGETASTESGGSKATWISNMLSDMPVSFPKIHGLIWYDASTSGPGGHSDWPIESSSSAQAAFASGIASSAYATDNYSNLGSGPVPVP